MTKLASPIRRKVLWDGSSTTVNYLGEACFGAATSSAIWRITRLTYSGTDNADITLEYADGNDEFDNIWDNRATLNYS